MLGADNAAGVREPTECAHDHSRDRPKQSRWRQLAVGPNHARPRSACSHDQNPRQGSLRIFATRSTTRCTENASDCTPSVSSSQRTGTATVACGCARVEYATTAVAVRWLRL